MAQETFEYSNKATGVLGGIASVLNFGGRTLVKTYDLATSAACKTADVAGKSACAAGSAVPKAFGSIKDAVSSVFNKFGGGEKRELKAKVAEYEEKIKKLYYEIGKEGSSAQKLESDKVNELIGKVREYEQEIERLNTRITEMAEIEKLKAEEAKKEKPPKKKVKVSEEHVVAAIKAAIEKALKQGEFDSSSQKEIFKKIAADLCDDEMEVRILAAAELGKMGLKAASDVLLEAVKFENPYLTAEIINSLTNMGDPKALSICKETAKSPNHRGRISSLRGLYKMGTEQEIAPYLIDALNDEHPEVRRTAVTFLGWKDISDALPGLIQTLQDKDETVRKAAVTALANIKDSSSVLPLMRTLADENIDIRKKALDALCNIIGEPVVFDVELKGKELAQAVNSLKEWWQSERIAKVDELITPEAPPVITETAADLSEPPSEPVVAEASSIETTPEQQTVIEPQAEAFTIETAPEEALTVEAQIVEAQTVEPQTVEAQTVEAQTVEPQTDASLEEQQEQLDEQAAFEAQWNEEALKKKLKSDLIAMCKSRDIECDETFTKAELIGMLLKGK